MKKVVQVVLCCMTLLWCFSLFAVDRANVPESPKVWTAKSGWPISVVWEHRQAQWYVGDGKSKVDGPYESRNKADEVARSKIRNKWKD